jgi:hypothetical protein
MSKVKLYKGAHSLQPGHAILVDFRFGRHFFFTLFSKQNCGFLSDNLLVEKIFYDGHNSFLNALIKLHSFVILSQNTTFLPFPLHTSTKYGMAGFEPLTSDGANR